MNKEKTIQEAKDLAKLDYESTCKRLGIGNAGYPNNWIKQELEGGKYVFVFGGAVAYVFVYPEQKKITACRRNKVKIKDFIYEDD